MNHPGWDHPSFMGRAVAHVVFDLDGTLVDSGADLASSVNHVLTTLGRDPIDPATVYRYVGNGARALVQRALGPEQRDLWDRGVEVFLAYYEQHLLDRTRLYPGLDELLAELSTARVSVSVLTNKPEALSRRILAGLGVLEMMAGVIGGDTLRARKPDPGGLMQLLRAMDTPATAAVLVGDSPIDSATARAAGVPFCGVAWGFDPSGLTAEAAPVVTSSRALCRLVLGAW